MPESVSDVNHILRLEDKVPICCEPEDSETFVVVEWGGSKHCDECRVVITKWNSQPI